MYENVRQTSSIDILKTARLTKLSLSEDETEYFENALCNMLSFIESALGKLEPSNKEEEFNSIGAARDDLPKKSFTREEILANSPETSGDCFHVPTTVES